MITAAAAIMVAVFLALAVSGEIFLKLLGVGMATAIFLDATVVRMLLVPALMQLFGRANWWMPRWLDRKLPRFDAAGSAVAAEKDMTTEGVMTVNALAALPLLTHRADGWGHPWWPLWLLFWAALIATAAWLIVRRRDRRGDPLDSAREILAERYAGGELSAEEYRERLGELERNPR